MLLNNLLLAVALTVLWPLWLLGLLAACEWLERRTLTTEEIVVRRLRQMADKAPEPIEAMVAEETAGIVAAYWSATGRQVPTAPAQDARRVPPAAEAEQDAPRRAAGGRHLRRSGGGGRHARRG